MHQVTCTSGGHHRAATPLRTPVTPRRDAPHACIPYRSIARKESYRTVPDARRWAAPSPSYAGLKSPGPGTPTGGIFQRYEATIKNFIFGSGGGSATVDLVGGDRWGGCGHRGGVHLQGRH